MKKLIFVLGPTAVGKTAFAIDLAKKLNTEIISADSRQIFKEMKIGTARPSLQEISEINHHFVASNSIFDNYNASTYEFEAIEKIEELFQTRENLIVAGGSGLYVDAILYGIDDLPSIDKNIRAEFQQKFEDEGIESIRFLLKNLDPETYKNVDLKNPKRILKAIEITVQTGKPYSEFLTGNKKKRNFETEIIVLNRQRDNLHKRINNRVDEMIRNGLIEEAKSLYEYKTLVALKTVGYRELFEYFDGKIDLETALELIKRNTRRYAKRQITWFKRYPNAHWIDITNGYDLDEVFKLIF